MHTPILRIVILGSGGREHSLALKLSKDPIVEKIVVVPGNAGIRGPKVTSTLNPGLLKPEDNFKELLGWAKDMCINLAIPGDQKYVVSGLGELFIKAGIPWFGPSKEAAIITRCPIEANVFMRQYSIPTVECGIYTDYESLKLLLNAMPENLKYEKPDGPIETPLGPMVNIVGSPRTALIMKAMWKKSGSDEWSFLDVCVPTTRRAALEFAKSILDEEGTCLMIEQNLRGVRVNMATINDGLSFYSFPPAAIFNEHPELGSAEDQGCVAPIQHFNREVLNEIDLKVIKPTLDDMPYLGVLSTNIVLTMDGPKVLGYEAHFNSAAAQALLPLLGRETSLASVIQACIHHRLEGVACNWEDKISVMVIVSATSRGATIKIPKPLRKGNRVYYEEGIKGITKPKHSTKIMGLQTSPSPVMGVCTFADTLEEARNGVYELVKQIEFDGKLCDRNIGKLVSRMNSRV
ncbi:hypothetical protein N431DRAFT_354511 [Stipitochalara longipes BDJ]|nr:hypothetical protein N431DRAFT_354511 [Stipitochalara longipes BDJ]